MWHSWMLSSVWRAAARGFSPELPHAIGVGLPNPNGRGSSGLKSLHAARPNLVSLFFMYAHV